MKRALLFLVILAVALVVALVFRVEQLRAGSRGAVGGSGTIEGVEVNVTSRVEARIAKVHVHEGDMVREGDVLVELDSSEADAELQQAVAQLRQAQAGLEAARANAESANRNAAAAHGNISAAESQLAALQSQEALARSVLERDEALLSQGIVSQATVDVERSKHDVLVKQVSAQEAAHHSSRDQAQAMSAAGRAAGDQALVAEHNVEVAQAGVASAEVRMRECKLVAPRRGMVASRNFEPGEEVQPGAAILTLTDVSEARTRFFLPNDDLAEAAPGRKVTVVADAYPGEIFSGKILSVSPRAEFTPRNVQTRQDRERLVYAVQVSVPNPSLKLRAGMPVEVRIGGKPQ